MIRKFYRDRIEKPKADDAVAAPVDKPTPVPSREESEDEPVFRGRESVEFDREQSAHWRGVK